MVRPEESRRVLASSLSCLGLALVFWAFFQINKWGPMRQVNPFGEDPYDAVGSIAVQAALLIGLLTFARALRLRELPPRTEKLVFILRGDALVLAAVLISLVADALAVLARPPGTNPWGRLLELELGAIFLLAVACGIALLRLSQGIQVPPPPSNPTPADGIDDLWALIRAPVIRAHSYLPQSLVRWVVDFESDRVFSRLPWIDPRRHPWRFAGAAGLLVGAILFLAQLREGLPPSPQTALLLGVIFIGIETAMALLGFALLGGFLGLRPPLRRRAPH